MCKTNKCPFKQANLQFGETCLRQIALFLSAILLSSNAFDVTKGNRHVDQCSGRPLFLPSAFVERICTFKSLHTASKVDLRGGLDIYIYIYINVDIYFYMDFT